MTKHRIAFAALLLCANAGAAPITVDTTADSGPGSLRAAIIAANALGADTIEFDIPGAGVKVIQLASPLDTIEDGDLLIDGYTQTGAQPNTAESGSNAVILIELDGASAGADTLGLGVCAPNVVIKGLAIRGFGVAGIGLGFTTSDDACKQGAADGAVVAGNFIGLQANGAPDGNESFGIRVWDSRVQIGGELADRNVIADNGAYGIELQKEGIKDTLVDGNVIGFNPDLSEPDGHKGAGVALLNEAAGATIGTAKLPNRIANNAIGIEVGDTASGNTLYANDIGPNSDLDIDLCPIGIVPCPEGATPNDDDDDDSGGNGVQNSPVLSKISLTAIDVTVAGELDVPTIVAGADYIIALYWSQACAAAGVGPGEVFVGTAIANLSDAAQEFEITVDGAVPEVGVLTATATDPDGNTSEFSACRGLPGIFRDSFE